MDIPCVPIDREMLRKIRAYKNLNLNYMIVTFICKLTIKLHDFFLSIFICCSRCTTLKLNLSDIFKTE